METDRTNVTSDPRVGQRFGDYVLEDQIGRGGMGVVFRARHAPTGDIVALKLMAPDLAHNASFRDRFVREAEAGPNLVHPHIVPVFETSEAHGELFIAMKLINGTDLKGLIQQEGRLDHQRALSIFRQAASALDAAHESGMVHRDVKPQNILVVPRETQTGTDQVYLTDFGLVRPITSETSASRTGQVFGSLPYMAPELIEGIPADGRADVYALGCVLYECLTGSIPFERDNEVSAVWAHIHEDPPLLTDTCRDLPGGLNDVVVKAMSKHPDDRFLTCGEFVTELELGLGRKLTALKYSHVRPLVERIPRGKTEREVWAPNFFPELSRVRSASRERLNWRKLTAFAAAAFILLSVQVGREGGIPRAVADVAEVAGSTGESLIESAFGDRNGEAKDLQVGSQPQGESLRGAGSVIERGGRDFRGLLPDGPRSSKGGDLLLPPDTVVRNGRIAFGRFTTCGPGTGCDVEIYSARADGRDPAHLTPGPLFGLGPEWSPDGRQIMFTGWQAAYTDVYIMDADGRNLRNLTESLNINEFGTSWSPDGRMIAFTRDPDYGLWIMNADGSDARQVTSESGPLEAGDWSPDGRKILFSRGRGCEDVVQVDCIPTGHKMYVVNVDGRNLTRLGPGSDAKWSPDGSKITFERRSDGCSRTLGPCTTDIYIMNADGSGVVNLTGSSDEFLAAPSWAPDGRHLIFQYGNVVASMSLSTGTIRQLTDLETANAPSWQPLLVIQ